MRCRIIRSVNVRGPTSPRSSSSHEQGADTGAPGAAQLTGQPLNHLEVLEAGRAAAARVGDLLAGILTALANPPSA